MGSSTFRKRDLGRYTKVYPFIRRTPEWGYVSDKSTIIEAVRLIMNNESSVSYTFAENGYMTAPTVTATAVDNGSGGQADVNVYVTSVTRTSTTIETSMAFSGEIHLQVMYVKEV